MPDVMYSSYHTGISPEGGLKVGQTLPDFFKGFCAQTY